MIRKGLKKNLLLENETRRSAPTQRTTAETVESQLESYTNVPLGESDSEKSDSDCEFCLIQMPPNLSLEKLNNLEIQLPNDNKTFETLDHFCTYTKQNSENSSGITYLNPQSYDNAQNEGTVTAHSITNLLVMSEKPFSNVGKEFYIPKVPPPLLPTDVKNRNFVTGCGKHAVSLSTDEHSVKKHKHSKKKKKKCKDSSLLQDSENVSINGSMLNEFSTTTDNYYQKPPKKKKRKKETRN